MGINIPTRSELIANQMSVAEMPKYFGADSVNYLSIDGLLAAVQSGIRRNPREPEDGGDGEWAKVQTGHCTACLTGEYPVKLQW